MAHTPNWLKKFIQALRRLLGASSAKQRIKILEQYHNGNVSVLRLEDPTIPGSVDLWRIDRHHERIKFFICVINTANFREELALLGGQPVGGKSKRGLANNLWTQIHEQRDILSTHYWITGWSREVNGVDVQGRNYRSNRVSGLSLLACDLQGAAASFAGDRYASRYCRAVIKRLAANEFRELAHHRSWQAAVDSIDWADWLQGLCRSANGGINSEHVLCPKRSRNNL